MAASHMVSSKVNMHHKSWVLTLGLGGDSGSSSIGAIGLVTRTLGTTLELAACLADKSGMILSRKLHSHQTMHICMHVRRDISTTITGLSVDAYSLPGMHGTQS